MAIYDLGTASLAANGEVTGVGTTWKAPLTLIRVGSTIVFKTEPVQIYTISEIISDTQINVYNPNSETVPAGTGYAILAHDGITVQGLAQDVAETLRYYQSKETSIESLLQFIGQDSFDWPRFEQLASQSTTGAAEALASQIAAADSAATAVSARNTTTAARDATIAAIDSAGDAGTLVTLSNKGISGVTPFLSSLDWNTFNFESGARYICLISSMTNAPEVITSTYPTTAACVIEVKSSRGLNAQKNIQVSTNTSSDNAYRVIDINQTVVGGVRSYTSREALYVSSGSQVGGANEARVRGLLDVYSKSETFQKSLNFSDLTDKPLARENLDVYAKGETYSRSEISSRYSVTLKDFGAVGDGVADDSYAMDQLSAFVNARAKYSAPVHVIIPNGVYKYSNGLNFVRPVSITAEQGATLNYLGTGAAIAIGDPSLDEDNPSADGFYQGEYTIDGVRFTGGQSASYGIYIRSYVFTPHIYNCEFMDFGKADSWAIYSQFECWDGLIKDCSFHNYYNKTAVGNFIGISGKKATSNVFDGGNSRFTIQDCSMTSYDDAPLGYFAYINSVKCVVTGGNCHWSSGGVLVGQNAHGSTIENFYTEVSTPSRPWMVTVLSEGGETAQNVLIKNCYANMHSEVIGRDGKIIGALDEGVVLRGWRVEDVSFSTFQSGQTLINMTGNAGQFGNTYARIKPVFNPYSSGAGLTYTVVNNPVASVNAWSSDDIEEGFWTPTLGGGATYNLATGYYRKQGKMVTCEFDIHVNSIAGGETGRIGGLPFPNGSMTGAGTVGYYAELALPVYWLGVRVDGGSNLITISGSTASTAGISGQIAALKSGSRIIGSVTYFTS